MRCVKLRTLYTVQSELNTEQLTHTGFKGTVKNCALPSLQGGSLKMTLTVPLIYFRYKPYSSLTFAIFALPTMLAKVNIEIF